MLYSCNEYPLFSHKSFGFEFSPHLQSSINFILLSIRRLGYVPRASTAENINRKVIELRKAAISCFIFHSTPKVAQARMLDSPSIEIARLHF